MKLKWPVFIVNGKKRIIRWLAGQIEWERELAKPRSVATIDSLAELAPESQIINGTGEPAKIAIGAHSFVRGRLLTFGHCGSIRIGEWCYVGHRTEIWSMSRVEIGNRVMIAHNVNIVDGTSHPRQPADRHLHFQKLMAGEFPRNPFDVPGVTSAPVVIEDDVWISFGVTILKGVRIGAGSIIAAGSMVMKDVPPGMLYRCEVKPVITSL